MWEVKRPKSQEKNKTLSPVWKSRGWGLTGLRTTVGHEVILLRSRGSHTLLLHAVSLCVFTCVWVCVYVQGSQRPKALDTQSWGYRILRAAQGVCRELNWGLLQAEPMLFPAPVGPQTLRGGKWRQCLGYRFMKVMASNPIVVQPRFHYRPSEHWEKKT